jgi:hypothetical protein
MPRRNRAAVASLGLGLLGALLVVPLALPAFYDWFPTNWLVQALNVVLWLMAVFLSPILILSALICGIVAMIGLRRGGRVLPAVAGLVIACLAFAFWLWVWNQPLIDRMI